MSVTQYLKKNICQSALKHDGAYYKKDGEPNIAEIKCNKKKGKWSKQKQPASCKKCVLV